MNTPELNTTENKAPSKAVTYFFYKIKDLRTNRILSIVFAALGTPLIALACALSMQDSMIRSDELRSLLMAMVGIGGICIFFSVAMGFIISAVNFRYLHDRTVVDMNYSLPLTTSQRFWGDYLSGLCVYIVPTLAAFVPANVIFWLGVLFERTTTTLTELPEYYIGALKYFALMILVMLMLYALVTVVVTLCARSFESAIYPMIINCIIPAVVLIVCYAVCDSLFLMDTQEILLSFLAPLSPVGLFIAVIFGIDNIADDICPMFTVGVIVPALIVIAIEVAAAYIFNRHRTVERTGNAFAYPLAYNIITGALLFCITALFAKVLYNNRSSYGNMTLFVVMIFITFIVFLLIEVITKRGFKKFGFAVLRYAVTVVGSFIVTILLCCANGFGMNLYVPDAEDVAYIETDIVETAYSSSNSILYGRNYYVSPYYYLSDSDRQNMTEYRTEESIKILTEHHSEYIRYLTTEEYTSPYTGIYYSKPSGYADRNYGFLNPCYETGKVIYHLKNGTTVSRYVGIDMFTADEYRTLYGEQTYKQNIYNAIDKFMAQIGGSAGTYYHTNVNEYNEYRLSDDAAKEILNAYRTDIEALTAEQYLCPHAVGGYTEGCIFRVGENSIFISIKSEYTNMVTAIKKYGLDKYQPETTYTKVMLNENGYISGKPVDNSDSFDFCPTRTYALDIKLEDVQKLIEVSPEEYLIGGNGYSLQLTCQNGSQKNLVVPLDYYELAKSLIGSALPFESFGSDYDKLIEAFTGDKLSSQVLEMGYDDFYAEYSTALNEAYKYLGAECSSVELDRCSSTIDYLEVSSHYTGKRGFLLYNIENSTYIYVETYENFEYMLNDSSHLSNKDIYPRTVFNTKEEIAKYFEINNG